MSGAGEPRSGAERLAGALASLGREHRIVHFNETTRTADDAAAAIGCEVAQIAKSLVFKTSETERPVLVIASGPNRVDERRLAEVLAEEIAGESIRRPDADFVRARTGYSIGGVAPIGHVEPPVTVIDADLFRHETIWAAAGTPNSVFALTPDQLVAMTGGRPAEIAERPST